MATTQTIIIESDGKIKLPKALMQEYDLKPLEEIRILPGKKALRIEKVSADDPYDKFLRLLEEGLKGVSWEEIEEGRKDRCF